MYLLCAFSSGKVCILTDYHINGIDYALWFIKNSMVQVMVLIALFSFQIAIKAYELELFEKLINRNGLTIYLVASKTEE